ncbi:MAG: hypothetical protein KatS3mg015_2512 [Fimbriimonadales bacterium]|nr:MAG: hypothetical protein KatS3mg015_2512 [Fimbriimonadales bacterium]
MACAGDYAAGLSGSGRHDAVAFHATQDPIHSHVHTPALSSESAGSAGVVTFTMRGRDGGAVPEAQTDSLHPALRSGRGGGRRDSGVAHGAIVRRLTPVECERLQALPDNWTNPLGNAPDSRRYAALGDAVTASVAEWIGVRMRAIAERV